MNSRNKWPMSPRYSPSPKNRDHSRCAVPVAELRVPGAEAQRIAHAWPPSVINVRPVSTASSDGSTPTAAPTRSHQMASTTQDTRLPADGYERQSAGRAFDEQTRVDDRRAAAPEPTAPPARSTRTTGTAAAEARDEHDSAAPGGLQRPAEPPRGERNAERQRRRRPRRWRPQSPAVQATGGRSTRPPAVAIGEERRQEVQGAASDRDRPPRDEARRARAAWQRAAAARPSRLDAARTPPTRTAAAAPRRRR